MLEILYASGLRVSELVTLKVANVSLDMGVLSVMGKGGKERMVPLGEEALLWLTRYLADARPQILAGTISDALFVTRRGAAMTRQAFWYLIKRRALQAGLVQAALAPRFASCLRHAPAQPRCGFARGTDAPRPRGYFDHANLHARRTRAPETTARQASPARLIQLYQQANATQYQQHTN